MEAPAEQAKEAGLCYVTDASPSISRVKQGKGFVYKDAAGKTILDKTTLEGIKHLANPPAW